MALVIKWNKRAERHLDKITEYINLHFGEVVTRTFIQRVFVITDHLRNFPELGIEHPENPKIRSILITKHNLMFYRYDERQVIILSFFDTRKHPTKRKP